MQIDWEIEILTVRHAQTPQAGSNNICTVDFIMLNMQYSITIHCRFIFPKNPLSLQKKSKTKLQQL